MTTTKVRVHELAKEIDKTSKDVLEACKKLGISANSAMNVLTDKEVDNLKKELLPPPPKKRLTAVFRPQNSAQGGRPAGIRPAGGQNRPAAQGGRPSGQNPRQAANPAGGNPRPTAGEEPVVRAAQIKEAAGKETLSLKPLQPLSGSHARQGEKGAVREEQRGQEERQIPADAISLKERPAVLENPKAQGEESRGESRGTSGHESQRPQEMNRDTQKSGQEAVREETGRDAQKSQGAEREEQRPRAQGEGRDGQRFQGERRDGQRSQEAGRDGQRFQGERRDGQRGQGGRDGQRVSGERRDGQRGQGGRDGQRVPGERRDGQRMQGTSRDGQRFQGDRPAGRTAQGMGQGGQRPQGDRPFNRGAQGDRPAGRTAQGDRPFSRDGQRPQGSQGGRPAGRGIPGGRPLGQGGQRPPYNKDAGGQGRPQGGVRNDGRNGARPARPAGEALPMGKPSAKQTQKPKTNSRQDRKRNEKQEAEEMFLKKGQRPGPRAPKAAAAVEEIKTIILPDTLTIKELADQMKIQPSAIVKKLFLSGKVVTINQEIDFETAEEIAMEYDILCEHEEKVDVLGELLKDIEDDEASLEKRPPVVCVMGHVDHGKTSLLDAIRSTHVTDKEAGGITQHIGAYVVECNGEPITFLDTPGHEAFTAMRMRGAQSTDIAILVVAADDGVMPQTVEAISHAKAAGVEIIVAVNKIDKPGANVEKVKQELTEYELIPEDWGGSTIFVPVSAHTKEGIDTLLEMILLASEVKELKADPNRRARGLVIEAELDKGKGPVATVLVQKGTLHIGDSIAVGSCYGKVRAMMDDKGRRVKEAAPSMPVEILGLNNVPGAGEIFVTTPSEKEARNFAETFISEGREKLLEDTKQKMSLDDLFHQIQAGNVKELNIIVKADVQGSVEAVKQSLQKLSNDEVVVKIIHGGVGAINESDVTLAATSNAIIIGFNVRPDVTAKSIAEREKVDLRLYKVIYQAIEDVESAMKGMLDPIFEEKVIGHAIVRQLFKASGVGTIAGSFVTDGKFQRDCKVRISREGAQIFEGALASLKRFKDDVKEVAKGYECGLVFEDFNDVQEDDTIEAYIMVEVPRQ